MFIELIFWLETLLKDYEEAARLRDSLKSFEEEEPVLHLKRLLREAIANEKFEVLVLF